MLEAAYRRRRLRLCVLAAAVGDVRLASGNRIKGRWRYRPRFETIGVPWGRQPPVLPENLLDQLANWGDEPDQILRFTKRYGPLPSGTSPGQGGRFSFSCEAWRTAQRAFREDWNKLAKRNPFIVWLPLPTEKGEEFIFEEGELSFRASSLGRYLRLELHAIGVERARLCRRPDCETPYFIAGHLGQRYCSEPCAAFGQKAAKRTWWHEKGHAERKRRRARKKAAHATKAVRRKRRG